MGSLPQAEPHGRPGELGHRSAVIAGTDLAVHPPGGSRAAAHQLAIYRLLLISPRSRLRLGTQARDYAGMTSDQPDVVSERPAALS